MRIFMLICLATVVATQYPYETDTNNDDELTKRNTDDTTASSKPEEEYNKIFYSFSAPEQDFNDLSAERNIARTLKKNLRVIFIKGPENTALENSALQLAKGVADDHTAIYVLTKQLDIAALANQLQTLKSKHSAKPEVHFIKYRTQADAENAQREIQAQYDSLPGTTNSNAPSSAPVADFASKSTSSLAINNLAASTVSTTVAPSRSSNSSRNLHLPLSRRNKI